MIKVLKKGMLTTVQDLGRRDYLEIGVGVSGAMDDFALSVANILVGNPCDAAGLEVTLGDCAFKFESGCTVAVTGCNMKPKLDGRSVPCWSAFRVDAGQTLEMTYPERGLRSYIAVAGGIDVPLVLGSRSTDLKAGFGGFEGRALREGDELKVCSHDSKICLKQGFGVSRRILRASECVATKIRMIPAAQWDWYSKEDRKRFFNAEWLVTSESSRLGYRLSGPEIKPTKAKELLSHGILPGCIQIPPSGQPVVQLKDANTCGGYPKFGVVIEADLRKFAQVRPGDLIRFELCSLDEAIKRRCKMIKNIEILKAQANKVRKYLSL